MKQRNFIAYFIFANLVLATSAFALQENIGNPGITPDSPFYFLDTIFDGLQSPEAFADEKAAEIVAMAQQNKLNALEKARERYEKAMEKRNREAGESEDKAEEVARQTSRHMEALLEIYEKIPEQAKQGIENAMENSFQGREMALNSLAERNRERANIIDEETIVQILEKAPEESKVSLQRKLESAGTETPIQSGKSAATAESFAAVNEEYMIYQDYLDVILGESRHFHRDISDTGTIEATIISMTKYDIFPYQLDEKEECKIEPYPLDTAIVRIDKIIDYTKYSEQTVEENPTEAMEKPTNGKEKLENDHVTTIPEHVEQRFVPKPKSPEYGPLQEGQEVRAKFLVSARPVNIIYASNPASPIEEPEQPLRAEMESSDITRDPSDTTSSNPTSATEEPTDNQGTLVHSTTSVSSGQTGAEPLQKTYKPIPKQGDYFVFTTKIIQSPEITQKQLPGLEEGDKFRAEIKYNGILYIEEYDLI
jgi:hypothetical protein